jgi:hypothetical protein
MDRKSGAPMVKLFEDKMGGREAEVVLEDPRMTGGIVNWYNGMKVVITSIIFPALKSIFFLVFGRCGRIYLLLIILLQASKK